MKEIRLHGRGGQGVVKASQLVVKAAVAGYSYGQSVPFFGVERKGSPVFGYLRLDDHEIRIKTQIYEPDILMIFDDSLDDMPETYAGLKQNGLVIINTKKQLDKLHVPVQTGEIITVDATGISEKLLGKNMPNTAMLGAFVKATKLVDDKLLFNEIEKTFGTQNRQAAVQAYNQITSHEKEENNHE